LGLGFHDPLSTITNGF